MAQKQFLSKVGTEYLLRQVLTMIEQKIQVRMVTTLDDQVTDAQLPSAKAVYDTIVDAIAGITNLQFVVVSALPSEGESNIIYLVKASVDPNDPVHVQWMWVNDQWVQLGSSEIDLSNYWQIDHLTEITNQEIQEIIDEIMV
jgi:hypothetical protein